MLQKYNPLMIIARQAFRGLLAINFRGWASDMQGMRDRGEESKIKDTWTGTFIGGNWGDLVAAINTGAGRDKNKATDTSTTELTAETIYTIEPFDWVGAQKDGLGFHTVAKHTLKAGDVVGVREKSQSLEVVTLALSGHVNKYSWLDFDKSSFSGKFLSVPERSQIPENIKEQLIVELYSK
jgi:hypothetical protein